MEPMLFDCADDAIKFPLRRVSHDNLCERHSVNKTTESKEGEHNPTIIVSIYFTIKYFIVTAQF
jgi:hypothetical protein